MASVVKGERTTELRSTAEYRTERKFTSTPLSVQTRQSQKRRTRKLWKNLFSNLSKGAKPEK